MTADSSLAPLVVACHACDPPHPLKGGQFVVGHATVRCGPFLFCGVSVVDCGDYLKAMLPSGSRDRRVVVMDGSLHKAIVATVLDSFKALAETPLAKALPAMEQ